MKNWENRLSGLLLIAAGVILLAILAYNFFIFPPAEGLEPVLLESSSAESSEDPEMPEPPGPVNLNTATLEELDALPGIGETLAQRILDYRETHGGFQSLEELMEVDGIGAATFEELSGKITLE